MNRVFGWDLGGANIKLASIEDGRVASVVQIPCPIIPERRKFDAAVEAALPLIALPASHAVTMTGELSDVFGGRAEGVAYLVDLMVRTVGAQPLSIYAGEAGFLASGDAKRHAIEVASANWHATASLVARRHADGLLVDAGTTTTDLIPIKAGKVAARGATDAERLTEGELLYTGVVRTPVMAVAHSAPFKRRVQRIAAERFATMADVWRLSRAIASHYKSNSQELLSRYSDDCLRRVWRAQQFSWWMTSMLHRPETGIPFDGRRQRAELEYVTSSRAAMTSLAENYVGTPFD